MLAAEQDLDLMVEIAKSLRRQKKASILGRISKDFCHFEKNLEVLGEQDGIILGCW